MTRDQRDDIDAMAASCGGCALVGRRDFLRDAGVLVASVLVALGAVPALAAAAPIELIRATGGGRSNKTYPIPGTDGAQIDKDEGTIVARWQGKLYVFALSCPHQNTAVKWYDKDNTFECPKHHSRYQPDGEYVKDSGRATRGLDRFAVQKAGTNVAVDLDKLYQEDTDEASWKTAFITL